MEPSSRASRITPSLTLSLGSKAKSLQAKGVDIINLGSGEPDFDTPEFIKAAAMGSLDAGFTKYTPSSGIPELRQAIADKLKTDNGLSYEPGQITVSCGAKHACLNVLLATLDAGDEVIIPAPYWLSYPEMVKIADGAPVVVPTRLENGFKITPEEFADAMTPKTRMIILNSPGNPTGSVYTREEIEALARVAAEEDILILSDEIYEKILFDNQKHCSVASLDAAFYPLTFTVNGFSKAYAMTGWRLGYVASPPWAAAAVEAIQSHSTSNVTSFAQKGALAAYRGPQECVQAMTQEYERRRDYLVTQLGSLPKVDFIRPQGTFYLLLEIGETKLSSTQFAERLLEEEKVMAIPGIAFGDDRTVRLSYATDMESLQRGVERLIGFLKRL
ncbi:pyridoxal phosphate-dependent aminotransferase [Methylacidimicrobium sp. B4]|uniref:pyridoxal phosphate-dependent aminotransferase n=1 Tax=Methylacidimicrobium sp. B4 TaxID=2796139 RepID=UPI001A8EF744|nr:pyridoxal phosphate-dependent aminotransferase [Methylacidimicrobium sp. B4]QSR84719.1 pyridoxal phosphate-dependent aminotransferase [Methylacidimicrobium sp. B4]